MKSKKNNFFGLKNKFNKVKESISNTKENVVSSISNQIESVNNTFNEYKTNLNDSKKRFKKFVKKNKLLMISTGAVLGTFTFAMTIYFSQTLSFYQMESRGSKQGNNIDTLYSHDSYITKKYRRSAARTYSGTLSGFPAITTRNGAEAMTSVSFWNSSEYPSPVYPYFTSNNTQSTTPSETPKLTDTEKMNKVWDENTLLNSSQFIQWAIENKQLKKHPAIDLQYYQAATNNTSEYYHKLPDDALAVEKNFNIDLTQPGYVVTGLYAPPGEVINIKIPGLTDEEVKALNLTLTIGDNENPSPGYNASNYSRASKRLPVMKTSLSITTNEFKYGSPFGGIINIVVNKEPGLNALKNVGMVMNGAVEALHYIHGYTTEAEWQRLTKEAKAPVFDIAADHIKFAGPVHTLTPYFKGDSATYTQPYNPKSYPYKSMDLFDKMALDALYTINKNAIWKQSYRHIHSNFVAFGAAVSFVGASYINSPWSWSDSILNYDNVLNEGSWGVMHENNHQNQGSWGYTGSGEVTNNVLTIASYLNFTNVSNNRYKWINYTAADGKISQRGNNHIYKLNGYFNVNYYLNDTNNNPSSSTAREGTDYDYSVIMSHFGTSTFQKIIRSYSDSTVTDFDGNKITIPESIKNDRNAIFVYRICAVTGYDWIEYTYNSGLISSDMKTKLETALSTNFPVTNTNDSTSGSSGSTGSSTNANKLKKFLPVGSFYASQIAYDVATDENGNVIEPSNYASIQRPFLVPKTSFTSGYKFNLSDSTKTATKKQMDSTYTLSDFKITKYPNSRSSYDSSSNTLTYYPDTSNLNNTDSFEYQVTVKDGGSNQYIVRYKVDLQLEGNTTEFVVPSNENYQQYYSSQITTHHNDINWSTSVGTNQNLSLLQNQIATNGNYLNTKTTKDSSNNYTFNFEIPFRRDVDVNYLELWPNSAYSRTPDGIIIKDQNDNVLYDDDFEKTAYPKFSFPSTRTNKLKVTLKTFDRVEDGTVDGVTNYKEEPKEKEIRLWYLDAGLKVSPTLILTPDSEWIYTVGDWKKGNKDGKVNGSSLYTILPGTKVAFGFTGTAFTVVGTKDIGYGSFDVYVDHKYYSTVSTSSKSRSANEGLFSVSNLSQGEHYVSITTKNSAPVEIQYFALEGTAQPISVNDWFYFLAIGLPVIVLLTIVITVLSVMYYLKVKNKRIAIFDKFKSKFKVKPIKQENDDEITLDKIEEKNNSKPIEDNKINLKEFKKEEHNKSTDTKSNPKKEKDKKSKRNK